MKFKRYLLLGISSICLLAGCNVAEKNSSTIVADEDKISLNINQADLIANVTDNAKYLNPNLLYDLETLDDSDSISAIVTLDREGLTAKYLKNSLGYKSVGEYAQSREAILDSYRMQAQQDALAKELLQKGLIDEVKHSYTTLFNGFSIKTNYGNFKKLERMGIASELTISEVYSLPQSTSDSSNFTVVENVVDVYETGIFNSSGVGYTGNNTAVAILDSGFDIHHTVFKGKSMPSDPLLEMSDVDAVLKSTYASGYQEGLKVTDVYVNSKIPFAYDYADKDSDVAPFDSNHGTHVAGIIGGKDDVITGVAINTQLVLMKVFGDVNNGAITEDILAALEDAVLLGVDAINLSLGTSCGFSRSSDNEYINTVYDSIEAAGISMVVAASNDYSSGYGGAQSNTNKASNPDSATVGSPGSYSTALSVASISGVKSKYITAEDGFVFFFNDANSAGAEQYDFYEMLGIEDGKDVVIDYVTVPGFGNPVNYANIDVKGKIALVKRGDNTFEEKARNAKNAGAIGCIVYNNIGGDIFMNAGNGLEIPFCSISKDDGEYLAKNKTGKLIFNNTNLAGPFMSDFSSWGPNPDLTLKPEITAHGGTILSSVPGGGYDEVSGTSMACPNLCGVVILVRQYLKEKYPNMSSVEIMRMTNQLLMSTATIAMDEYNNPYSVRRQGSGLGNLKNALNTLAYLTVDGQDKAKIELKDDPKETGIYTLKFNINNTSSKVLKYNLGNYTMTETLSTSDSEFVAERAYMLNPSTTISVSGNGSVSGTIITVEANGTAVVEYTLKLSNEEKKYLRQSFENGMYVEGFATLDSMNEDNIDLNIPFLAFFGDWTVAPIFDVDYFQVEAEKNNVAIDDEDKIQADYYETTPLGTYYYSYVIPLGSYVYEIDETKYDPIAASKEHAAMGYNIETINGITTVYAGLLRNAKTMTTTITNNTTGEVIYEHVKKDQIKAHSSGGTQVPAYDLIEFTARDYALENNTQYTFRMEAELDYGDGGVDTNLNNSFEFTFYVDYEAPIITDAEYYAKYDRTLKENRYYVDFYVYDNHYSQSIRPFTLIDGEISSLDEYPTPIYCETKGGITKVTLEITDYMDLLKHGTSVKDEENGSQYPMTNGLGIMVDDYALNANYYYVALPGTDATRLSFTKSNHVFEVGNQINLLDFIQTNDPTFDPDAVGAQDYLARLHWTSSNEDVVRVNNGIVEAVGSGTARVTVQGIANSSAILTASCEFTVLQEYGNNSGSSGDTKFSNDVSLQEISFTHFDVINAFIDGADISEIGETGDRIFLTSKSSVSFYPSEKIRLGYEIKPWNLDPSRYELIWSSSNEEVATVDATGLVTGISEGSANITLRIKVDGKQSNLLARLRVTIKNEFVIEGSTLIAYKGFGGDVVIPDDEGILYIGSFAFSLYTLDLEIKVDEDDYDANKTADGNTTIESVTIPADVMEVQRYAFYNCPNLKKVTFLGRQKDEKYLTTGIIRDHAFYGCTSLTDINLENVEVIGQRGFYGCTSLETIDLSKIYALGEQAFANCTSLLYVDITTLRNVGRNVFANCANLTSFDSGEFTNFSEGMFRNTGLTEVHFYYDRIPNRAFEGCNNLTSVIIHNDLIYVGERAFANIKNEYAVTFEKGCQFLYSEAFANSKLKEIVLPNSSFDIEEDVFLNCNSLNSIEFNANSYINSNLGGVFNGCSQLVEFTLTNNNHYSLNSDKNLLLNKDENIIVFAAPGFNYGAYEIPSTILAIGDSAFDGITSLTSLVIPQGVESIGNYAFANTSNLKSLTFADAVEIGNYAFANSALNSIDLSLQNSIGDYAFMATDLTEVSISASSTIGEGAFSYINTLENVTINEDVNVGDYAFANNEALAAVVILGNAVISNYMFTDCANLVTVTLTAVANGEIGDYAFAGCTSIETFNSNDTMTTIGDYAFADNNSLSSIDLANVITIGDYAFSTRAEEPLRATRLALLDLTSATTIGDYAFAYNKYLTEVSASKLTSIGSYAFSNCTVLVEIDGSSTVETIKEGTFYEASKLATVNISGIKYVEDTAFYFASKLENIDLTNVISVGIQGFEYCSSLTELNLLNATTLRDGAFRGATKVTSVNIPKIEVIGSEALSQLAVTTIKLPNTLNSVSPMAFYYNTNQTEFTADGVTQGIYEINEYATLHDGVLYTKTDNNKYLLSSYPTGKTSSEYTVLEGTVRIEYAAVANNSSITKVVLPDDLKTIGNNAFYYCNLLNTVEFRSTVAPTLEGTITSNSIEYDTNSEVYKLLNKYFNLNGYYPLFYGQFITDIGMNAKKLNIIVPSNKNIVGYDNILYDLYFNLDDMKKSDYEAMDANTIDFLDKIVLVPEENINLTHQDVIDNARIAYDLMKQDLTDFGYTKAQVDEMVSRLTYAESIYNSLMIERIEKKYEFLIQDIENLGSQYKFEKISDYLSILDALDLVDRDDEEYIDRSNVDSFKKGYEDYFKNLNEDIKQLESISTKSTTAVNKPGLTALVTVASSSFLAASLALLRRRWFF